MTKFGHMLKRLGSFLVRGLYLLPAILLGIWFLHLVYFPDTAISEYLAVAKPDPAEDIFKSILKNKEPAPRDHFHMIDDYITRAEPMAPLCLNCHGTYPHSKEKKIRSILNFHNGFIACSVCHARNEPDDKTIGFAWDDRNTGVIQEKVEGAYGKYPAKIFPVRQLTGDSRIVIRPVDEEAARQYIKHKESFTPDQIARAKIKVHSNISAKPVICADCHRQAGYLDFEALGFSPQRVAHLNSSEVVGMIDKYKTFYLPTEIDFGSGE